MHCHVCQYNLAGLDGATVCPECGTSVDPFGEGSVRSDRFFRWLSTASWLVACLPVVVYVYGFFVWAWAYLWLGHKPYPDDLSSVPLLNIMTLVFWLAFAGIGLLLPALIVQCGLVAAMLYGRDGGWTQRNPKPVLRFVITLLVYACVVGLLWLGLFDIGFFAD